MAKEEDGILEDWQCWGWFYKKVGMWKIAETEEGINGRIVEMLVWTRKQMKHKKLLLFDIKFFQNLYWGLSCTLLCYLTLKKRTLFKIQLFWEVASLAFIKCYDTHIKMMINLINLISVSKNIRLTPPFSLFNVYCKFACSFLAITAWYFFPGLT